MSGRCRRASIKKLIHTPSCKPTQNDYVESFNGKLREECVRVSWSRNLFEARRIIANWRRDYKECRPHSSLNYSTPAEFAQRESRGKVVDSVHLENDIAGFHLAYAQTAGGITSETCGDWALAKVVGTLRRSCLLFRTDHR